MDVRVITLRYQEGLQGFPEDALRKAISGREVLEAREHFFMHGNMPHMALTLLLGDAPAGGGEAGGFRKPSQGPDPEATLEESRRPFYRDLKRWRNEQSKAEGKPAYAIARNAQLAEIARRLPRSLAELKEIDGIGEAFCRDYGAKVLGVIPDQLGPAPSPAASAEDDASHDGGSDAAGEKDSGPVGT